MTVVETERVPTMGVDAHWRLYVNPQFLDGQTLTQAATIIAAHEVEHLLRDHHARFKDIPGSAMLKNVAMDLEINDDLPDADRSALPGGLYPDSFDLPRDLFAEQYMIDIMDRVVELPAGTCSGGSGAGGAEDWEIDGAGKPGVDTVAGETLRDAVANDLLNHARTHGRGSVPSGALIWAEARVNAQSTRVDWRRMLGGCLATALGGLQAPELTRTRISRRQRPMMPLRPGIRRHQPRVGVVVDTSGSMGPDTVQAVFDIARRMGEIVVVQCDAEVTSVSRRLPREWRGGGGTDLCPGIAVAAANADVVVVVTDCCTPWPEAPTPVPLIVAATTNGDAPSWARVIRIAVEENAE
jgi:predicted metal-dependent peptidase